MNGRIVITGGTGFIGRALARLLAESGYEVVVLTRRAGKAEPAGSGRIVHASWDGVTAAGWGHLADGALAIVNLAGESIAERWTDEKRRGILDSRVRAGEAVAQAVREAERKPRVLVQASAVGYYGDRPFSETLTEASPPGRGFLAEVCVRWEASTAPVEALGVRRAVIRTGMVLGMDGGALPRILPPFKAFAGGPVGSGNQGVSWIHLRDEIRAIKWLIENPSASGPFNLTAPAPVTMKEFAGTLGRVLRRPSWLPVPAAVLKAVLGDMAEEVLLGGQRVVPAALVKGGYCFAFSAIEPALRDLLA